MVIAAILAAGESRRMGRTKALLKIDGQTFLSRILRSCELANVVPVVALGSHAREIDDTGVLAGVSTVTNDRLELGPMGSIRAVLDCPTTSGAQALLVWPVDMPRVMPETICQLVERFRTDSKPVIVPTFHGKRGHPVLFSSEVFAELRDSTADGGARSVVRRDVSRVGVVEVNDQGTLDQINTQADFNRIFS